MYALFVLGQFGHRWYFTLTPSNEPRLECSYQELIQGPFLNNGLYLLWREFRPAPRL